MSAIEINVPLLDEKLSELETARPWQPGVIAKLEAMIQTGDDYALFRVNPLQFAQEKTIAENEAIDLFLYGTKCGLFEMEWNLLCAFCAHVVKNFRELTKLHPHFICDFCGAENDVALDDYIHVSFTISPQIRHISFLDPDSLSIEDYYLKYQFAKGIIFPGGHSLEEVAGLLTRLMTYVMPLEKRSLEVTLDPGTLQVKDLSKGASLTLFLGEANESSITPASVQLEDGQFRFDDEPTTPKKFDFPVAPFHLQVAGELPSGKMEIEFTNRMDTKSALWVMYFPPDFESNYVQFESFLSGKRLLTTQTFRDLFRFETGPTTEGIDVKDITFLFTDLKGSTALYDRIGDLKAYYLVRQHFETLAKVIGKNSGAIVKTIGDAIMATFMNPVDAVEAAIEMLQEIEAFNRTISDDIILKIGIHRGPSIVVALNDRLDYFGQTVNIAARVQGLAGAGEIYISGDAHNYPGVDDVLAEWEVASEQANVKGVSEMLDVCKITVRH
ncbi:MAG: adenylate/guanylate cyclase domain-containing protein [Gammaproteobacteria bacterium]|nr:adenylate/guanylate cyclase domain-containing protein [Gammaproteobacteria bacterium]